MIGCRSGIRGYERGKGWGEGSTLSCPGAVAAEWRGWDVV